MIKGKISTEESMNKPVQKDFNFIMEIIKSVLYEYVQLVSCLARIHFI